MLHTYYFMNQLLVTVRNGHNSTECYITGFFLLKSEIFGIFVMWFRRARWSAGDGFLPYYSTVDLESDRGGCGICVWIGHSPFSSTPFFLSICLLCCHHFALDSISLLISYLGILGHYSALRRGGGGNHRLTWGQLDRQWDWCLSEYEG